MKTLLIIFIAALSVFTHSDTDTDTDTDIKGEWGVYCGSSSKIYNKKGHPAMVLVDGHTYISTRYKLSKDKGINIYYMDVIEAGFPGKDVPWNDLSRNQPIGVFKQISHKKSTLKWYGLIDHSGNEIEVMSDFSTEGVNILKRCR